MTESSRITDETMEALHDVSTQGLVDAMTRAGYPQGYMEGVRPIQPGQKMVARAVTLRFVPARPDLAEDKPVGEESPEYAAMALCGPNKALVVDAMGWKYSSIGGDIKFLGLKHRDAAGLVTDGAARDSITLKEYGFPIFCASTTAKQGGTEFLPWEVNGEIQCGGVLVRPGDALVGDDDGVVVVPARIASAMVDYARRHEEAEEVVKAQLEAERVSPGKYYPFTDRTWDLYEQKTGKKRP